MKNFETTVLISPDLTKNNIEQIDKKFEKMVTDRGGSVTGREEWGLRDLSYPIKNVKKAFYNFYHLTFEGSKIQELKRILSQNEEILRYLFIKVSKHDELPTKLVKEKE